MEFCGCGDLAQKVERYKRRRQYIDEAVLWRYLIQCLKALQHLHEKSICHRDLKVANTFLAEDGSVKIGDMNVSKRLTNGQLQTQIGTPYYMSPEIWNNRPYDSSSDIWALGCMIYELASLKPPFTGDSFPALKRAVTAGRFQPIPRKYSDTLQKVIASMLKLNPRERPSAESLLRSPDLASKLQYDEVATSFALEEQAREQRLKLMETIKVPQNLRKLGSALPKPCYPDVRPNSPSAWTVEEQGKQKKRENRAPVPPPPPPVSEAENVAPPSVLMLPVDPNRDESSSKVYSAVPLKPAAPSAAQQAAPPLSSIAEYYSRRPLAPIGQPSGAQQHSAMPAPPANFHPYNVYEPPSYKQPYAPPVQSQVPGAYNRGRMVPPPPANPPPAAPRPVAAAGYPARVQYQHRMW